MGILTKMRKQTATYWSPSTPDGFGGKTYGTATALTVRWEDKIELFIDKDGREAQSSAQVFVGSDVAVEGYLYLGASSAADPRTVAGSREIRAFEKIPNLKASEFLRRAFL